jgi:DNA-binding GntR family transcriptional regulator
MIKLKAEGYLESKVGSGTYVAHSLPESRLKRYFLRQQSDYTRETLVNIIARSGYPNQQVWLEDRDGNGLYLYSAPKG